MAIIPREEEPQILVPMLDITTAMPGASPAEVEERVTLPIEKLVHQISGVEYVYSTSAPGQSLVIVRFLVGTPQEDALIKVYSKLYSNFDRMPPGVSQPLIKARSIDDVPILAMTLWGEHYDGYQLRAIADEMQHNIAQISDVSETTIIGGLPRTMRVVLSTEKLSAYGLSPMAIVGHLQAANASVQAGNFSDNNQEVRVDAGNLFTQPRGSGSCRRRRGARASGVSARRGRQDCRWPRGTFELCGLRHDDCEPGSSAPISGRDNYGGQAQRDQCHRYLQCSAQAHASRCRA